VRTTAFEVIKTKNNRFFKPVGRMEENIEKKIHDIPLAEVDTLTLKDPVSAVAQI